MRLALTALGRHAESRPDDAAFHDGAETITFRQLAGRVGGLACRLKRRQRVAIFGHACIDWVVAATTTFESLAEPFAMQVDPAEVVAAQILTALERDARSAYSYGIERLYILVQRLAPRIVDRAIARQLAQIRRRNTASGRAL